LLPALFPIPTFVVSYLYMPWTVKGMAVWSWQAGGGSIFFLLIPVAADEDHRAGREPIVGVAFHSLLCSLASYTVPLTWSPCRKRVSCWLRFGFCTLVARLVWRKGLLDIKRASNVIGRVVSINTQWTCLRQMNVHLKRFLPLVFTATRNLRHTFHVDPLKCYR
jgi:hypothetical protein